MRRSLFLSLVLAASVAVLGACGPKNPEPVKPSPTPAPPATASPSPNPSPSGTPIKATPTPGGKKTDVKDVNKDVKPAVTQTPKAK